MKADKDGKSWAKVFFENGNILVIKDPVHAHRNMDPLKYTCLMDSNEKIIDCFALSTVRSTYACQWDTIQNCLKTNSEIPNAMTIETALKHAKVMDAILNKHDLFK